VVITVNLPGSMTRIGGDFIVATQRAVTLSCACVIPSYVASFVFEVNQNEFMRHGQGVRPAYSKLRFVIIELTSLLSTI